MMTCFKFTSKLFEKVLKRSCVSGLGGSIFLSSAIAIDCASNPPITIGNFLSPYNSSKIRAYAPF